MAVLVEAISVIIKAEIVEDRYPGGFEGFRADCPNYKTLIAYTELIRLGFMSPADVEGYINELQAYGIEYLVDGAARDLCVVDQLRGPLARCDWLEFGHVNLDNDPRKRVAAARLVGCEIMTVGMPPEGWDFENSLSNQFGFVPSEHLDKSLKFLRHEDGLDVYLNIISGEEVCVARSELFPD